MVHLRVASGTGSSSSATGASKGTLSPKLRGKTPLSSLTAAAPAPWRAAAQWQHRRPDSSDFSKEYSTQNLGFFFQKYELFKVAWGFRYLFHSLKRPKSKSG